MRQTVFNGQVGIEILTDLYRSMREHQHEGQVFVEANIGTEYRVRLINKTPRRVLAVLSVDGLSAMDGKDASKDSGGYILEGYQEIDIPGWRLNNEEVARFQFGGFGESYAARMGKPTNVGVIGCHFVEESIKLPKGAPSVAHTGSEIPMNAPMGMPPADMERWTDRDDYKGDSGDTKTISVRGPSKQAVGTGFGRQSHHRVHSTHFERGNDLATLQIRYNDRENLIKMGVLKDEPTPNAFPASQGCAPPAGWKG